MDIKGFFVKLGSSIKDHKADLKMTIGTVGVVGGTVLLCRETLKLPGIVSEYKEAKQKLIDENAEKKEVTKLRVKTAGKVVLNFAPGATVEAGGLGSMWSGYSNMKAAFVGAGIAFNELKAFTDRYRQGVRDKFGEETDQELAHGYEVKTVKYVDENGVEKEEEAKVYPNKLPSPYARYFVTEFSTAAEDSYTYNSTVLINQQRLINEYFRAHKKMMLNEVYQMLGFKMSVAGNHVGWIYDPEAPVGDNYIDLRIQTVYRQDSDDPEHYERVFMIDPNVDGMVEAKAVRMGLMDK